MNIVNSDRINNLKAQVKEECLKRIYVSSTPNSTSVQSYGGASYDYSTTPANGTIIKEEHREKIVVPLNAINNKFKLTENQKVVDEEDVAALEAFILTCQQQKKVDKNAANNACSGGCTGYCYSTCTGECSGSCSGSCSSTCSGSCSGTCSNTCTNECRGCGGHCSSSCTEGDCFGGCSGATCQDNCLGNTCSSGSSSTGSCRACDSVGCQDYCAGNGCYGQACLISCDRSDCRGREGNPDTGAPG